MGERIRIGLALSSGGARGAAHVGVLKVLQREGVEIAAIAGTSIGAIVGGAYAAGIPIERLEREWREADLPRVVKSFLPTFPRAGLSSGSEFRKELRRLLGEVRIEDLPIPFAAVATDIDTGEAVILREGMLYDALRASASIPGIFHPVRWRGRLLVDGGLVEPLPIRVCRELGATLVLGVDIVPSPRPTTAERRGVWDRLGNRLREGVENRTWIPGGLAELLDDLFGERPVDLRPLPGVYSIINQSVAIFQREILKLKLTLWPADLLIRPKLPPGINYLTAATGIRAGEEAMQEALPELKERINSRFRRCAPSGS